jgi:hypothetical protein
MIESSSKEPSPKWFMAETIIGSETIPGTRIES